MAPPPTSVRAQNLQVKDGDLAANEVLLSQAEHLRSARSWLNVAAFGGLDDGEPGQNGKEEDEEEGRGHGNLSSAFEVNENVGGLGFLPPKDSLDHLPGVPATTSTDPTTIFLRKQLLGKARPPAFRQNADATPKHTRAARTRYVTRREDTDDEEDSRSGVVKGKNEAKNSHQNGLTAEMVHPSNDNSKIEPESAASNGEELDRSQVDNPPFRSKKRGTSYLDELLAERAKKKKKKQKRGG